MAEFDLNESSRAKADVARGAFADDIPLDTYTTTDAMGGGDTIITPGGNAETPFSTRNVDAYGRPINTLAYVEDEYVDVFDTSWMPPSKLKVLAGAANDYYKMLKEDQGLKPEVPDLSSFVLDRDSRLRLKEYPDINLINENTGRPNKLTTTASNKGGREIVRKHLCFSKWTPEMSKAAEANLRKNDQSLKSRPSAKNACADLDLGGEDGPHYVKRASIELALLTPVVSNVPCQYKIALPDHPRLVFKEFLGSMSKPTVAIWGSLRVLVFLDTEGKLSEL
ncbi:hypothetical protein RRG08_029096 [Elysia crispata]|uniref:Uncharacterized protein n=1 Tax=Elysia crispata TaxID=231223 RepID=A0AAE0YTE1_9GAST|nr:hypothetical protein RRG08_029096 [Elysia crispata]